MHTRRPGDGLPEDVTPPAGSHALFNPPGPDMLFTWPRPALRRLVASVAASAVTALVLAWVTSWQMTMVTSWCAGGGVFVATLVPLVVRADGDMTRQVATVEDESRASSNLILLASSTVSSGPCISSAGCTLASAGAVPSTTRCGSMPSASPSGRRTVSDGSSARTVPAPTSTASLSARRRCASALASGPVIQRLVPSGAAIRPSRVAASLSTTYGRPVRRWVR